MANEEWKDLYGWEGFYEVSSQGRVRSKVRTGVIRNGGIRSYGGRIIKAIPKQNGYLCVNLTRRGKRFQMHVHRAVLLSFVGFPIDRQEACHYDGIRSNNALDNLRWDTRSANHLDKRRHGTSSLPRRNLKKMRQP